VDGVDNILGIRFLPNWWSILHNEVQKKFKIKKLHWKKMFIIILLF